MESIIDFIVKIKSVFAKKRARTDFFYAKSTFQSLHFLSLFDKIIAVGIFGEN